MMKELVELLKQARQDKKIPLSKISDQTKIQVHYLEALEKGDFARFSGEVYLKGALRNYAEAVGLDPKEVLELYRTLKGEKPAPEEPVIPPQDLPAAAPGRPRGEKGPSYTYGLIVLVLLLAAGGYWFATYYQRDRVPVEPDPPGNQADPAEEPGPAAPGQDQPPAAGVEIKISDGESNSRETVFSVGDVEQLEIKLNCTGPCWIRLLVDGEEEFPPRTLPQGEELIVEAADNISMRLGNPPGVRLWVNGCEVSEIGHYKNAHNFLFVRE